MRRFKLSVSGERHAFVGMLADRAARSDSDRFCTFRVPHPLNETGEVIIDAESISEARACLSRACWDLIQELEDVLRTLELDVRGPSASERVALPEVRLGAV